MTSAVLAGLLMRQPFQPFSFMLGDNTEVHVDQPSQVKHEPGNPIVTVMWRGGAESIIDLDHVAMIDVKPAR